MPVTLASLVQRIAKLENDLALAKAAIASMPAPDVIATKAYVDAVVKAATAPVPVPTPAVDPATYAVDWAKINTGPIGRVCIYGTADCDPTSADSIVAIHEKAFRIILAAGGDSVISWDLTGSSPHPYKGNSAYSADTRLSDAPASAWPRIAALAGKLGIKWGITISAGKPEGGWYATDAEAVAAWKELVGYHYATFGMTRYYLDANNAQKPGMVRELAAAFPQCLVLAENWDNAGNSVSLGKVVWLWECLGMGRNNDEGYYYFPPPDNFTGRLTVYLNCLDKMAATEKPKAIAWLAANKGKWQWIADAWYGLPTIPQELR